MNECGKKWYESRAEAKRFIRRTRDGHDSRNLRAYKCRSCNGWHVTSQRTADLTWYRENT